MIFGVTKREKFALAALALLLALALLWLVWR
jgi:hypothetical protein